MMTLEKWFCASPVWHAMLQNIDNEGLIEFAHELREKDPEGRKISNYGGWQSRDIMVRNSPIPDCMVLLHNNINAGLSQIHDQWHFKSPLIVDNYWININNCGDFNATHIHPNSVMSGTYYVQADGTGGFMLDRSHSDAFLWSSYTWADTELTCVKVAYKPEPSKLVMFPSWVSHSVDPSESKEERISIAFNASF